MCRLNNSSLRSFKREPARGLATSLRRLRLCAATALAAPTIADAQAQASPSADSAPSAQVAEGIVTAQRRAENVQTVPIAISAFDSVTLARAGVTQASDLGLVTPGLVYSTVVGYAMPYIRGIGSGASGPGFENPIATYVDGVYYAAQSGALLSLGNIAGIEVDKGPQGTLFGRNATGGAIQIRTRTPQARPQGEVEVGYGDYNTSEARLYATGGLAPNLAADLAVGFSHQNDGYGRNLANGRDVDHSSDLLARSKLLFTPDARTSVTLALDYGRTLGVPTLAPAPGTTPQFDPPVASNPRDVYGSPQPFLRNTQWGVAVTVKRDFAFASLTSITSYRNTNYKSLFDSTLTAEPGTTFFITGKEPHRQASQEIQLASRGGGPFSWVTGTYLYWERSGYLSPNTIGGDSFALFGLPQGILQSPNRETESAAVFGQGSYKLDPATTLTAGLRYTYEHKTAHFVETLPDFGINDFDQKGIRSFSNVSWRLAVQHDLVAGTMIYASYNRGYKSGGFNNAPTLDNFDIRPETLDAVESGFKSTLLDRRLRLNASAFYYSYSNIQTTSYPSGSLVITNGASATLYGLDLDGEFILTPELRMTAGLEALHSRFGSFPNAPISTPISAADGGGTSYATLPDGAEGRVLPKAPKLTFNVSANYTKALPFGRLELDATYSYDDGWFGEADNRLRQPAYNLVNASGSLSDLSGDFTLRLWVKNLLDEDYAEMLASQTNGDFVQYAPPRTYGASVTKRF